MGAVWLAEDRKLRRPVALKLMAASHAASLRARTRFEREAMAVARLRSTHIVDVYDYGIDAGRPFIAMELLEGEDLAARLSHVGKLDLATTARIVLQVAKGLEVAHRAGIVHRDLKPANIFLVPQPLDTSSAPGAQENVKVFDFGVAKALANPTEGDITLEGTLIGTPRYMSPEQIANAGKTDHRSDVWALAVIAFRCLTGRMPFDGHGVGSVFMSICNHAAPLVSTLSPELPDVLDAVFARGFEKQPAKRFQSAMDFAVAIAGVAEINISSTHLRRLSFVSIPEDSQPSPLAESTCVLDPTSAWPAEGSLDASSRSLAGDDRRARRTTIGMTVLTLCAVIGIGAAGGARATAPANAARDTVWAAQSASDDMAKLSRSRATEPQRQPPAAPAPTAAEKQAASKEPPTRATPTARVSTPPRKTTPPANSKVESDRGLFTTRDPYPRR
jgi:serine/threonine protein kinase